MKVIERNYLIAIVISCALHVLGMSVISIVTPSSYLRKKTYTRVDFLGPILKRTAFDIMLEGSAPEAQTIYGTDPVVYEENYLKASAPERYIFKNADVEDYFHQEGRDIRRDIVDIQKALPGFLLMTKKSRSSRETAPLEEGIEIEVDAEDMPGNTIILEDDRRIAVKVFLQKDGKISNVEPLTTTGDPRLDLFAVNYVKGLGYLREDLAKAGESSGEVRLIIRKGRGL